MVPSYTLNIIFWFSGKHVAESVYFSSLKSFASKENYSSNSGQLFWRSLGTNKYIDRYGDLHPIASLSAQKLQSTINYSYPMRPDLSDIQNHSIRSAH